MTRRKGVAAEEDAGPAGPARLAARRSITLVGKASAFQATEVLRTSLDENLAMIAESVRFLVEAGREVIFDAEHFFDGWKADPDYALHAVRRPRPRPGAGWSCSATPTAAACPRRSPEITRAVVDRRSPCPWASTATTTATWRWPTRWPPSTPGPSRCRARSTASASGAATPT